MLAGIISVIVCGCQPPVITSTVPPDPITVQQGNDLGVSLTGGRFVSSSSGGLLVIDTVIGGDGTNVSGTFSSPTDEGQLDLTLHAAPGAALGHHTLAYANTFAAFLITLSGGISNPVDFYVTCPTCPLPPLLSSYQDNLTGSLDFALRRGNTYNVRFHGQNLQSNPVLAVADSGYGVTLGAISASDPNGTFIDAPVTVASDADTGVHLVGATTTGGMSNTLQLGASPSSTSARVVTAVNPACISTGTTNIVVTGTNFQYGDTVSVFDQNSVQLGNFNAGVSPPDTLSAHITVGSPALYLTVNGGTAVASNPFPVNCGLPVPIMGSVTPAHVTVGTTLLFKCEGVNFGANGPQSVVPNNFFFHPIHADPDKVVVFALFFDPALYTPGSTVKLGVQDHNGVFSNQQAVIIDAAPPPGLPYISSASTNAGSFGFHPGNDTDGVVNGQNLQGVTDISSTVPNVGLTFSSIVADPSGEFVTFHVHAAANAVLTNDEATNIIVTTSQGIRSNPAGGLNVYVVPP